jgi:hypothetical protein
LACANAVTVAVPLTLIGPLYREEFVVGVLPSMV